MINPQFLQDFMMVAKRRENYSLVIPKAKAILAVFVFCVGLSIVDDFWRAGLPAGLKALGIMGCVLFVVVFAFWFSRNLVHVLWQDSKIFWEAQSGHILIPLKSWDGIYFFWFQQFVLLWLFCLLLDREFLFLSFFLVSAGGPLLGYQKLCVSLRTQCMVLALALLVVSILLHLDPVIQSKSLKARVWA